MKYRPGFSKSSSSLLGLSEWQEKEKCNPVNCAVDADGDLLDNLTLELRVHPPEVVVDNISHEKYTVVTLISANRPGSLIHVVQHFTELGLCIQSARVTSCGGWFVDVFHLSEPSGARVSDSRKLSSIRRVLDLLPESAEELLDGDETDDADRVSSTVFELLGDDRPGLLAELVALLLQSGCSVRRAALWTRARRVAAVLSVTEGGRAISDPLKVGRLRQLMLSALRWRRAQVQARAGSDAAALLEGLGEEEGACGAGRGVLGEDGRQGECGGADRERAECAGADQRQMECGGDDREQAECAGAGRGRLEFKAGASHAHAHAEVPPGSSTQLPAAVPSALSDRRQSSTKRVCFQDEGSDGPPCKALPSRAPGLPATCPFSPLSTSAGVSVHAVRGQVHLERRLHQLFLADDVEALAAAGESALARLAEESGEEGSDSSEAWAFPEGAFVPGARAAPRRKESVERAAAAPGAGSATSSASGVLASPPASFATCASSAALECAARQRDAEDDDRPAARLAGPEARGPVLLGGAASPARVRSPFEDADAPAAAPSAAAPAAAALPCSLLSRAQAAARAATAPPATAALEPTATAAMPAPSLGSRARTLEDPAAPAWALPGPSREEAPPPPQRGWSLGSRQPSAPAAASPGSGAQAEPEAPKVEASFDPGSGYWLVEVRCRDRPKLLFDSVCTLADLRLDVWHATIDVDRQGRALQEFFVRPRGVWGRSDRPGGAAEAPGASDPEPQAHCLAGAESVRRDELRAGSLARASALSPLLYRANLALERGAGGLPAGLSPGLAQGAGGPAGTSQTGMAPLMPAGPVADEAPELDRLRMMLCAALQRRFPRGLKVHAASRDRYGCLFALSAALARAGLSVARAKARTFAASRSCGHTLHVVDARGAAPRAEDVAAALCAAGGIACAPGFEGAQAAREGAQGAFYFAVLPRGG